MTTLPPSATFDSSAEGISKLDPDLVVLAMRLVAKWSEIDMWHANAVIRMAHADYLVLHEILKDLRAYRPNALDRAAEEALDDETFQLYSNLRAQLEPISKLRNELVHRIWAYSPERPHTLVLADSKQFARTEAESAHRMAQLREIAKKHILELGIEDYQVFKALEVRPRMENKYARMVTRAELELLNRKASFGHACMMGLAAIVDQTPLQRDAELRAQLLAIVQARLDPRPPSPSRSPESPHESD